MPMKLLFSCLGFGLLCLPVAAGAERGNLPNLVFILCDNLGNGDIACFYPQAKHRTPYLDQLASEGCRLTSYYSASGVCSPSRAAFMTACYPRRIDMHLSYEGQAVLKPVDKRGLHTDEQTIAELLKAKGYATACFGKWHLGDQPEFLPDKHGFDHFLGIPYSEDMLPGIDPNRPWPPLPLIRGSRVVEAPVDAQFLTERLTAEAVQFIRDHRHQPFFLFFPETGPGSRRESYPGPGFRGRSANGLYGDAIEELDWSAGEILEVLDELQLREETIVVWTSDNGAVRRTPQQGSNAPYQGFGYSTTEGGMRMPCIVRWPGRIPAGVVSDEICTMMDWLPTMAGLTGQALPDRAIDGHDLLPILTMPATAHSAYDDVGFFYYQTSQLQAVRAGPWKLYLPLAAKLAAGKNPKPLAQGLALYDVRTDVGEQFEVSQQHAAVVDRLLGLADGARRTLGDMEQRGSQQREGGWVAHPVPAVLVP
jgi:arylsulfatase A-like enzyme